MEIEKNRCMREKVYEKLKSLIINGELKKGEKIIETEYAKKFEVSRTPIREALRMLELEGLVDSYEKGGVRVAEIDEEDIREIYKIRFNLENMVLEEIFTKKKIDLKNIKKNLRETRKKLFKSNYNVDEIIELFSEFNKEFYKLSELKYVIKLITNINEYIKRFRRLCLIDEKRVIEAYNQHKDLIKYIEDREYEKAKAINDEHLLESQNFVLNKIKNNKNL